ncbi:hypothetical protein [Chromobacterium violaceum]|uniref:hypothetical protein n=1 Tax=Chromobacterium violaceum TaxID=536 RepID=UPI0015FCCC4D|nr:hypothetical protein [Chromobacterium violaceum]MBA8736072.1 hypothetical protein [Chromobacterium violaceum]
MNKNNQLIYSFIKKIDTESFSHTIHIPNLIVSCRSDIESLSRKRGSASSAETDEVVLYQPIAEAFQRVLPVPNLIDTNLSLFKIPHKTKAKQTDISIRRIEHYEANKDNKNISCSCYVEIKTLFNADKTKIEEIVEDIEKIKICIREYPQSKFFFCIIGEESKINSFTTHKCWPMGKLDLFFRKKTSSTDPDKILLKDKSSEKKVTDFFAIARSCCTKTDVKVYVWEIFLMCNKEIPPATIKYEISEKF